MSRIPICTGTTAYRRPLRVALSGLATGALLVVGNTAARAEVQLYGAVDNYVSYDSGGKGSSTQVGSGAGSTSRFGLTGTEDLGGGLESGFRLESGFTANNGTLQSTNTIFNREANVWLSSRRYGMLKLGRQFPTIFPLSSQVDPYALTKLSLMSNLAYATSDLGGERDRYRFACGERRELHHAGYERFLRAGAVRL